MSRTRSILLPLLAALALLAGASAAAAQVPRPDPKMPDAPPPGAAVPETTPRDTTGQSPAENLSDRLERSKGVIRPPGHVDPEIHVTPPATGDPMPVIPPPGSPGGDQAVQPK